MSSLEGRTIFEKRLKLAKNLAGLAAYAFASGNLLEALRNPQNPLYLNTKILINGGDFIIHALSQIVPGGEIGNTIKEPILIRYADFVLVGGFLFLGAKYIINEWKDYVTLTREMGTKRFLGKAPVPQSKKPNMVIYSETNDVLSNLVEMATSTGRIKDSKRTPVVGVLFSTGVPYVLGDGKMSYYLQSNLSELNNPLSIKQGSSIHDTAGVNRAEELCFICLDQFSGIFPEKQRGLFLSPEKIWQELSNICTETPGILVGKTITIIMFDQKQIITGYSDIEKDLRVLEKKYNFKLNIIKPEDLLINRITRLIEKIAKNKKQDQSINIVVLDQKSTSKDLMDQVEDPVTRSLRNKVNIQNIQNLNIFRVAVSSNYLVMGVSKGYKNKKLEQSEASTMLKNADLIIVIGEGDKEIIELYKNINETNARLGDPALRPGKIIMVIDREESAKQLKKTYGIKPFVPLNEVLLEFCKKITHVKKKKKIIK